MEFAPKKPPPENLPYTTLDNISRSRRNRQSGWDLRLRFPLETRPTGVGAFKNTCTERQE